MTESTVYVGEHIVLDSIVKGRRINDAEIIAKDLKEAKLGGLIKESNKTGSEEDDW